MNRKVLINKCKLMKSAVRKTMHKHGKNWIVSTLLFLALLSGTLMVGHADTNSQFTKPMNNGHPRQSLVNANANKMLHVNKSNSQEDQNKSNNSKNVQRIQYKAQNLHKSLVNHALKSNNNQQLNESRVKSNQTLTFNEKQSNQVKVSQPSVNNDTPEAHFFEGDYINKPFMGVNCKVYSNGGFEFTNEMVNESDSDIINKYLSPNSSLIRFQPEAIKFDPGFNASKMVGVPFVFRGLSSLKYLNFTNFNLDQVPLALSGYNHINNIGVASNSPSIFENMSGIFSNDSNLRSITLPNSFDTSKVTDMSQMFANDSKLQTLNLGSNFAKQTTDMRGMFSGDDNLIFPNIFNTSNVTDMSQMFANDKNLGSLTLPDSFDTSNVTDMSQMFANDKNLGSLTLPNSFNTSNVSNMRYMFNNDISLHSLILPDLFNTYAAASNERYSDGNHNYDSDPNINPNYYFSSHSHSYHRERDYGMYGMLPKCLKAFTINSPDTVFTPGAFASLGLAVNGGNGIEQDGDFNTPNAMYRPISMYKEIGENDSDGQPYTSAVPINTWAFQNGNQLGTFVFNRHTKPNHISFENYDNHEPVNVSNRISNHKIMIDSDDPDQKFVDHNYIVDQVPLNDVQNGIVYVTYQDDGLNYKYNKANNSVEFTGGTANRDLSDFSKRDNRVRNASSITFDNNVDMSNVTNMSNMFANCQMSSLNLGSNFDTSNVTNMGNMFGRCTNLQSLTLPQSFNTSNVNNMSNMFAGDASLESLKGIENDSNFKTSNVTNMSGMFGGDKALTTINLNNNFDTTKVSDMSDMFNGDRNLKSFILPKSFDTSNVHHKNGMIINDNNLSLITIRSPKTKLLSEILKYSTHDQNQIKSSIFINVPVNNNGKTYNDIQFGYSPLLFYKELGQKDANGQPLTVGHHRNTTSDANDFALGNVGTFITGKNPGTNVTPSLVQDDIIFKHGNNIIKQEAKAGKYKSTFNVKSDVPSQYNLTDPTNLTFIYDGLTHVIQLGINRPNGNNVMPVKPVNNHPNNPVKPNHHNKPSTPNVPNIPNIPNKPITPNVPNNPVKPEPSNVIPEIPNSPQIHHRRVSRVNNPDNVKINQSAIYHGHKITRLAHNNLYWFYVIRPCLAHTDLVTIGKAKHYDKAFHPNQLVTEKIYRLFKVSTKRGSVLRYEIHANLGKGYKRYFVTGNPEFTRNAYWQRKDLKMTRKFAKKYHYMKALVIHNCLLHNSRHYTKYSTVKHLHKGTVIRVKGLVYITHSHQTRFYLDNGKWVTSNKNFVKLLAK